MSGWRVLTLGTVFETVTGTTPSKSEDSFWGSLVPFVKPPELIDGEVYSAADRLSEAGVTQAKMVPVDTVLVSCIGNLGKIGITMMPVAFNQQINGILPSTDVALPKFMFYQTLSPFFRNTLEALATGTTIRIVNKAKFNSIPIFLPPLSEQKRIVEILDEAFDGIAKATANVQRNLANAQGVFVQHLQSAFIRYTKGGVIKPIPEIAQHSLGKMLDKSKNRGEFQPYLRNLNVRWFDFDLSDVLEMKFLPDEVEKYTAIKGDVLICEGGYPGRAAIWTDDNPVYFQKALHRVRFHDPVHAKWFVYYLFAKDQSNELKKHFNGAGIQHFTGKALAKFSIPIPRQEELYKAISLFDKLRAETQTLEILYRRKLAALEELKQSLLHKAFTGQLTGKEDIAA